MVILTNILLVSKTSVFRPIGEELFYRGIVHHCFRVKWEFLLIPSLLWIALLFLVCLFFTYARMKSGSILGAIMAHTGFNLAMIYFIFYHIL